MLFDVPGVIYCSILLSHSKSMVDKKIFPIIEPAVQVDVCPMQMSFIHWVTNFGSKVNCSISLQSPNEMV